MKQTQKFGFDTLLIDKDLKYNEKWSPSGVSDYKKVINRGILKDMDVYQTKNIIYNLQYLEYIDFQLKELKLHSVIEKMLYKTFIITSVAIVESIFYFVLKQSGKNKTKNEELIFTSKTNKKKLDGEDIIIENNIYKIIDPIETEMSLDSMIKKMEKAKCLDLEHKYFPYLKHFKDLRNRVHIHITEGKSLETDFWKFEKADYLFVKYILLKILMDEKIQKTSRDDIYIGKLVPKVYEFLNISKEERMEVIKKYN